MTFVTWLVMATVLIYGVIGAFLGALIPNFGIIEDAVVTVLQISNLGLAARTLLGFVGGVMIWYALSFLRIRVIRLLLSYDHWFIGKQSFIDYVSDLFHRYLFSRTCNCSVYHKLVLFIALGNVFETITGQ